MGPLIRDDEEGRRELREMLLVQLSFRAQRIDTPPMHPLGPLAAAAETHLNDLQADMEAGSRSLDHIQEDLAKVRESLLANQLKQAAPMGALMKRIVELRACVSQQRETMRELRHDIRRIRGLDGHRARPEP